MCVQSLGREDALEEEMAAHSSIRAWRIPWTEEPGGLRSTGSQRARQGGTQAHVPTARMHRLGLCEFTARVCEV